MGGFCSSDPEPVNTTTTIVSGTEIPEWVSQGGERLFNEAENLARNDYQPFGGPRIQPFGDHCHVHDDSLPFARRRLRRRSCRPICLDLAATNRTKRFASALIRSAPRYALNHRIRSVRETSTRGVE